MNGEVLRGLYLRSLISLIIELRRYCQVNQPKVKTNAHAASSADEQLRFPLSR